MADYCDDANNGFCPQSHKTVSTNDILLHNQDEKIVSFGNT